MTRRRTYRPDIADRVSGVLSSFDGTCPRCDDPIVSQSSRVVRVRDSWVHVQCASGGRDE